MSLISTTVKLDTIGFWNDGNWQGSKPDPGSGDGTHMDRDDVGFSDQRKNWNAFALPLAVGDIRSVTGTFRLRYVVGSQPVGLFMRYSSVDETALTISDHTTSFVTRGTATPADAPGSVPWTRDVFNATEIGLVAGGNPSSGDIQQVSEIDWTAAWTQHPAATVFDLLGPYPALAALLDQVGGQLLLRDVIALHEALGFVGWRAHGLRHRWSDVRELLRELREAPRPRVYVSI